MSAWGLILLFNNNTNEIIYMNTKSKKFLVALTTIVLATFFFSQNVLAQRLSIYEVSVTNVTSNSAFTPIFSVTHNLTAPVLFTLGQPASVELEDLAEGGSPAALEVFYDNIRNTVVEINTAAGTPADGPFTNAGESASFQIRAHSGADYLSMAAMLLPTNDSFMALNAVELPSRRGETVTYTALGYDAGTELNDQWCFNIPGPQCDGTPNGEGTNTERTDRGNFVHVSSGIHNTGDLTPEQYDWRNPVAIVTVTRIR